MSARGLDVCFLRRAVFTKGRRAIIRTPRFEAAGRTAASSHYYVYRDRDRKIAPSFLNGVRLSARLADLRLLDV